MEYFYVIGAAFVGLILMRLGYAIGNHWRLEKKAAVDLANKQRAREYEISESIEETKRIKERLLGLEDELGLERRMDMTNFPLGPITHTYFKKDSNFPARPKLNVNKSKTKGH